MTLQGLEGPRRGLIATRGTVYVGLLNVGGNWDNAAKSGVGYVNGNNSLTNSNANIGARLARILFTVTRAPPHGETYKEPTRAGSPDRGDSQGTECRQEVADEPHRPLRP